MTNGSPTRRALLAAGASAALGSLAGCQQYLGGQSGGDGSGAGDDASAGEDAGADDAGTNGETGADDAGTNGETGADDEAADAPTDAADLPTVEDPPDAVYVPSHREGVRMLDPVQSGDYVVGTMLSYAHPFWTITDGAVEPVAVGEDDAHLMATVWDAETRTVLPTGEGLTMRVRDDAGDLLYERSPWSMLSQSMGFHFGDNVPLDGAGSYELEIELPPVATRTTGAFAGRFDSFETVAVEFEYDESVRAALLEQVQYVDETQRGVPGALEPGHGGGMGESDGTGGDGTTDGHGEMDGDHGMSVASLPAPDALPGTLQHGADDGPRSDDADVPIGVVESFRGASPYLLVSPRTPYNAIPLPGATLSAAVARDGQQVTTVRLRPTLDDVAGFHYGAEVEELSPGDELVVRFEAPPQLARHQGYETAFVDMDAVEATVEGW